MDVKDYVCNHWCQWMVPLWHHCENSLIKIILGTFIFRVHVSITMIVFNFTNWGIIHNLFVFIHYYIHLLFWTGNIQLKFLRTHRFLITWCNMATSLHLLGSLGCKHHYLMWYDTVVSVSGRFVMSFIHHKARCKTTGWCSGLRPQHNQTRSILVSMKGEMMDGPFHRSSLTDSLWNCAQDVILLQARGAAVRIVLISTV